MLDFLDRLREKPEGYRLRVTLLVSVGITAVIFVAWIFSFIGSAPVPERDVRVVEETSPFNSIQEGFSDLVKESAEQFQKLQEGFGTLEFQMSPEE